MRPYPSPSRRKSIHKHCTHPFCVTMNRNAINRSETFSSFQTKETIATNNDEVDNVTRSPRALCRNRSSSWSNDIWEHNSSESDIKNFEIADLTRVKSLPTKLPSYLYYRDTADVETENHQLNDNIQINSSIAKKENYRSRIKQNENAVDQYLEHTIRRTNNIQISRQDPKTSHLESLFVKLIGLIISLLNNKTIIVIIVVIIGASLMKFSSDIYDESKFLKELAIIEQKYNIDSNAILQVKSGILATYKKEDTVTYIFVYNSKNQENYEHLTKFVNEIANVSARYLRSNTVQNQHLVLRHDELNMKDHGELVHKIRTVFNDRGVVLFENLEKVPVHLVRAFHYYCDEFNPLAKRSAVLFTMDLQNCSVEIDQEVSHNLLEKCLSKKWSSLTDDILYPLLTRVIYIVVDLTKIY